MRPGTRKVALTAHVACSVGWLGAVVVFLTLAVTALTTQDPALTRAVLLTMQPVTWYALLPLAFASLLTGLVSSLGTAWGLFRHYWVVFKLLLNILANIVLLLYTQTVDVIAASAADRATSDASLRTLAFSPVLHASAALLLLLVATVLAVYKPRGTIGRQ